MKLLLKNGQVFQNDQITKQDILIQNDKIMAIGQNLNNLIADIDKEIDLQGKLVTPGLVDVHVHYRDPGQTYKETITTGSKAAAHGGFTTVCAMPNLDPTPDTAEQMQYMQKRNREDGVVNIYQYATITKNRLGKELVDYEALQQAGAIAFSDDGSGIQNAEIMYEAMQRIAKTGSILAEHVEDNNLKQNGVINAGNRANMLKVPGIPNVCESSQLARDLVLAEATNVHYHVCHVSTKMSVELIRWAKQQGVNVTCEVAPHHLLLTDDDIKENDSNYKMNPPLRKKEDQQSLINGLLDGTIDMIATDHAPHSEQEKSSNLQAAAFGITGSETAFSTLYTKFVKTGIFTLKQLIHWLTDRPAKIFKLNQTGLLLPGYSADLAVFDLQKEHKLTNEDYFSKGVNTPFTNQKVYGMTSLTIVNGKIVYQQ